MLTRTIEQLFYAPTGSMLLILFGAILPVRFWRQGLSIFIFGWFTLYIASIPFTTHMLSYWVETYPALNIEQLPPPIGTGPLDKTKDQPQAIVVLGYDRYTDAPEFAEQSTTSGADMERLRYAALLHRYTHLPIAVIGGDPLKTGTSEAELMKRSLELDFLVPVTWADGNSMNTHDNAIYAKMLLKKEGIEHVYLVTHAWHMKRAVMSFEGQGLRVTPAPTAFTTFNRMQSGWHAFIPAAGSMQQNNRYLHEFIGMLWYGITQ